MAQDPSEFFGPARDSSLTPEEKGALWRAMQARMSDGVLSGELAMKEEEKVTAFFAAAGSKLLTESEMHGIHQALAEERELISLFVPARAETLATEEKQMLFQSLQRSMYAMTGSLQQSFWSKFTSELSFRILVPVSAFIVLIGAGAGISYAAEQALPGDYLYVVKRVSEQIRTGLRFSRVSKAEAETERVGRRLQEAAALQEKKRLSDAVSSTLDNDFRLERRKAIEHIQVLETEGNTEAATRIRARLNAFEDGFEKLQKGRNIVDEALMLQKHVSSRFSSSVQSASNMSSTTSSVLSAQNSSAFSEGKTRATIRIEKHEESDSDGTSVKADVEAQIDTSTESANKIASPAEAVIDVIRSTEEGSTKIHVNIKAKASSTIVTESTSD